MTADLVDAYYAVAQDLQRQADIFSQASKLVADMADSYSEARMREKQPPQVDVPALPQGCHRSHPHEDMNAECERLTEIARSGSTRP